MSSVSKRLQSIKKKQTTDLTEPATPVTSPVRITEETKSPSIVTKYEMDDFFRMNTGECKELDFFGQTPAHITDPTYPNKHNRSLNEFFDTHPQKKEAIVSTDTGDIIGDFRIALLQVTTCNIQIAKDTLSRRRINDSVDTCSKIADVFYEQMLANTVLIGEYIDLLIKIQKRGARIMEFFFKRVKENFANRLTRSDDDRLADYMIIAHLYCVHKLSPVIMTEYNDSGIFFRFINPIYKEIDPANEQSITRFVRVMDIVRDTVVAATATLAESPYKTMISSIRRRISEGAFTFSDRIKLETLCDKF